MSNNQVNGTYQEDYLENTKNIKQSKNKKLGCSCTRVSFIIGTSALAPETL